MSGKTVTNISYGIIRNTTLPAITMCPSSLDFRKLAKLNGNVSILYEQYLKMLIVENGSRSGSDNLPRHLYDIYFKALEMYYNLKTPSININNYILENLTPFMNERNESLLSAWFESSYSQGEIDNDLERNNDDSYRMISLPMESLIITGPHSKSPFVYKCYTFFSHSHSSWNKINIDVKNISIMLKLDEHSMPIAKAMMISIMMHSPNALPFENYNYFNLGHLYIIRYSQWNIERLGKGYDTDCREYDPKDYTRNDCIHDCFQDKVKRHCQTQDFVGSIMLKRIIYFQQRNLNLSKCVVNRKIQFESLKSREDQCHDECHFTYYSFTISKFVEIDIHQAYFIIKHNEMIDLTIRYIPEMPLLTFICNFGGILGMWLGVSFVSILENIWKILRSNILSRTSFTFNIRNALFIKTNSNSRRIN